MSLPKVLIINQPFNKNTGGGVTLSNLFCNWERKKLAVACLGYLLTQKMDPTPCNNYYQLGSKERKWIFPLNLFGRKYYSGPINIGDRSNNKQKVVGKRSKFRVKLILDFIVPLFNYIGISHFQAKTSLSPGFCKWLDDLDPDVYYIQAETRESVLFCTEIIKYKKRPVIFHMMDDWPSLIGVKGPLKKYWEQKIDKEFRHLLNKADLLMGISDYMCEEYKNRYGRNFVTFHNPINLNFWKKAQRNNYHLAKNPTVLYAGRIGLGIDDSLRNIAEAIKMINKELNADIKFKIQTNKVPNWISNYKNVKHQEFVAYEELPNVFAQADILILPYDFSSESRSYIKYSMPTKAPEYMASGTPIIIYAPQDTALVKYAEEYNWAEVVTESNTTVLMEKLKNLILDMPLRKEIATTAKNVAETRHDSDLVAQEFQQMILKTAEKTIIYK
ncbi:Glycosyltransferase involved in cell wall bisynthesis [Salegentibacter holothuriorum]|uniref:Glycosyltransferase involved in cell wall bisynthesis n=1 Tax=Salegentibacter holothuriorum TaxID=241145 RepID=A0A1T5CRV4_9FLAO|nr:glycosyltransferase [Salegentibacter holothuriorum]SKB62086.1 Glycosyltransferase involved in cell wall bisynthesis [Salegentibacter holothuriorum]